MENINLEKQIALKSAAKEVYKQVKLNVVTEGIAIGGFLVIAVTSYFPNKSVLLAMTLILCLVQIFFLRKDFMYKTYLEKKYMIK